MKTRNYFFILLFIIAICSFSLKAQNKDNENIFLSKDNPDYKPKMVSEFTDEDGFYIPNALSDTLWTGIVIYPTNIYKNLNIQSKTDIVLSENTEVSVFKEENKMAFIRVKGSNKRGWIKLEDIKRISDNKDSNPTVKTHENSNNITYESSDVEVLPYFKGGEKEMMNFLALNLKYPSISVEQGIRGTVMLRFLVEKDGKISNITVQRSLDRYCDAEAIRLVKSMPLWIPGRKSGQNVSVYYILPIHFRLN
ncbi:energy transducer TonB [Dysgonomonas sp. 521]|uniref:energy transducer TonB n=1 Tax=Dysgonomonas sp. 521 TaxID=2302932 RepID=UPI0013D200A8|nr:energy transducer TonB [Dysgonomonas sp. 521]NDV96999.1 energy transducer TonB [Dysgonomonas sp. 521]